jgi:hypothetical protein
MIITFYFGFQAIICDKNHVDPETTLYFPKKTWVSHSSICLLRSGLVHQSALNVSDFLRWPCLSNLRFYGALIFWPNRIWIYIGFT